QAEATGVGCRNAQAGHREGAHSCLDYGVLYSYKLGKSCFYHWFFPPVLKLKSMVGSGSGVLAYGALFNKSVYLVLAVANLLHDLHRVFSQHRSPLYLAEAGVVAADSSTDGLEGPAV